MTNSRLIWAGLLLFVLAERVASQDSALGKPNTVIIDKDGKAIDGEYGRFNQRGNPIPVKLYSGSDHVVGNVDNNRQKLLAGARDGFGTAALNGDRAKQASIRAFSTKQDLKTVKDLANEDLEGGAASAGRHYGGEADFDKKNKDRTAHLVGKDTKKGNQEQVDTVAEGYDANRKTFKVAKAENAKSQVKLDPNTQTKYDGNGQIGVENKQKRGKGDLYLYTIRQNQRTKKVDTELTSSVGEYGDDVTGSDFDRKLKGNRKWRCEGAALREGESICYDMKTGRKVGRVVTTRDVVTVYDNKGIRLGKAKIRKVSKNSYEAVVSDGLVTAKVTRLSSVNCIKEIGGTKQKIKILKPIKFTYPEKNSKGKRMFTWPSCFKIKADFEVPKGVDVSQIALEFDANVKPLGRLMCQDAASCGKKCFYCNVCDSNQKMNMMRKSSSNLCEKKDKNRYTAEVEVCPPPKDFNRGICAAFLKDADYLNKKGTGSFTIIIWQMPKNTAQLKKEFFDKIKAPFVGRITKSTLKFEYLAKNFNNVGGSYQPTDEELLEWYITKKHVKDPLKKLKPLACIRQTVNYKYGGSKVDAGDLIEVATTDFRQFFGKRCPKKKTSDQAQFKEHERAYNAAKKGGGGLLGGIFGGK